LEARRLVRASIEHVFAHLAHPERLPRYTAPLWLTVDAGEKRGSAQIVGFRGYFIGLPIESVQRVVLRPPFSLEMTQIRGSLRSFVWRCTLKSGEDGTELVLHVEADIAIPLISEDAARQFLVQHLERTLDRIKLAAERTVPARRAGRGAPGSQAVQAPDEAGPDVIEDEPAAAGVAPREAPADPESESRDARPQAEAVPLPAGDGAERSGTGAEAKPTVPNVRHRRRRRRRGGNRPPVAQGPPRQPPAAHSPGGA